MRTCTSCGEQFKLLPGKPGLIGTCPTCSFDDVERVGGNMVYSHKTAPELEIKSMDDAKLFARKTRRFGAGVTASLTESKLGPRERESGKQGSGAESGAIYISKTGEKHCVKR